jgi:hypothetical protein
MHTILRDCYSKIAAFEHSSIKNRENENEMLFGSAMQHKITAYPAQDSMNEWILTR